MILQRLAISLRKQDWFTVAIETLIVVFGVFIGLQVNNWNETRVERQLAKDYVKRLETDLRTDLANSRLLTEYHEQVLAAVVRTGELLSADAPDAKELIQMAYRATEINQLPPERATWDQIVSSGHLGLLPEGAVEGGLSTYYAFDAMKVTYDALEQTPYRKALRSKIPIPVQQAIRVGCSDLLDEQSILLGFKEECEIEADPETLQAVADAIRADPAIREHLRLQFAEATTAVNNLQGNSALISSALELLGAAPEGSTDEGTVQ
ncbi:hypothetical protein L53_05920 [Hyphomonas sp. L-53-1-40]|uniref:hypothetical protein n=1 Tax=Hyphomonas sp. L-53-1-40 TaxID=1207058 RepID=UPI000458B0D7|nr:hypothetical protein [Hyphomonas sp. L-53-1-40]KCZ64033.1 hypothetical protein L53_05920 [Hyphomonas sp. L-53-1-40]